MYTLLCKTFNLVFITDITPWVVGNINPQILKKNSSRAYPQNYRSITQLSCLVNVYTSALSRRWNADDDSVDIRVALGENTIDDMFVLFSMI